MTEHPIVESIKATGKYVLMKPYEPIEEGPKFTAGLLMSAPGCIRPTPTVFMSTDEEIAATGQCELIAVYFLGDRLSGHNGIVHGGLLATLLDEALCRCGFAMLPHNVGVTAALNVRYRQPTPTNSYLLLKGVTTRVEGRKAWVDGKTYVLDPEFSGDVESLVPTMDADLLVIEPHWYEKLLGGPASRVHEQRSSQAAQ